MKKTLIVLAVLMLSLMLFVCCDGSSKVKHTVTFNANGGNGNIEEQKVEEGAKAVKPAVMPTHAGWGFLGWTTSEDGTEAFKFDEETITSDITLYAMWNKSYTVGGTGPAGGKIIYDVDADNESATNDGLTSDECGWKYLEAATSNCTATASSTFLFGYYKPSSPGTARQVVTSENSSIGKGKTNTDALVNAMQSSAYDNSSNPTDKYAAKICADYEYGGYADWFLPSKDELHVMYGYKGDLGMGGSYFWSSSEKSASHAYYEDFNSGSQNDTYRDANYYVRALRSF